MGATSANFHPHWAPHGLPQTKMQAGAATARAQMAGSLAKRAQVPFLQVDYAQQSSMLTEALRKVPTSASLARRTPPQAGALAVAAASPHKQPAQRKDLEALPKQPYIEAQVSDVLLNYIEHSSKAQALEDA